MLRTQLLLIITACAAASRAPVRVRDVLAPLAGELFYGTCALPACDTLSLALWDLANQTSTDLHDFPFDSFEDGYVADSALAPGGGQAFVVLVEDNAPAEVAAAAEALGLRASVVRRTTAKNERLLVMRLVRD